MVRMALKNWTAHCEDLQVPQDWSQQAGPSESNASLRASRFNMQGLTFRFRGQNQRKTNVSARARGSYVFLTKPSGFTQPLDWLRSTCIIESTLLFSS